VPASFYRRNRAIAAVGKALTALSPVLWIAWGASVRNSFWDDGSNVGEPGLVVAAWGTGLIGRLMWAGADLKMTNQIEAHGGRIRRGAAIASMVFASVSVIPYVNLIATPATWVSGAVASAKIRNGKDDMGLTQASALPVTFPVHGTHGWTTRYTLRF
jgi:hypothetical protein